MLILSPQARIDFDDILLYTFQTWVIARADRYENDLNDAITLLRAFPDSGSPRNDVFEGCRCILVESHIIYYTVVDAVTLVIRILHKRQDANGIVSLDQHEKRDRPSR